MRLYCTREAVKASLESTGSRLDPLIDGHIEASSVYVENLLDRRFIPVTETRLYPWPQRYGNSLILYLDADLLAVTTLKAAAQDASPTTIASTDYFLEPVNVPPYRRIEIDLSSSSSFTSGDTSQRSISVLGRWAYSEETVTAGLLAAAITDAAATTCTITNASLMGVGDTLLIGTEQVRVTAKAVLTTTTTVNDADVQAESSEVSITLADATKVNVGEVLLLDSERVLVTDIAGNVITVDRAVDGSVLAAHVTGITVYAYRTLTIVRGENGTTATTHLISAPVSRYAPPGDVVDYVRARALSLLKQGQAGWAGQSSSGEASSTQSMSGLMQLEQCLIQSYAGVTI